MKQVLAMESNDTYSTKSYTEAFWHYGKQIAKGALLLGGGFLLYSAWRNLGTQEKPVFSTNNMLPTRNDLEPSLPFSYQYEAPKFEIAYQEPSAKRRATHCIDPNIASPFQIGSGNAGTYYPNGALLSSGDYVIVWQESGYIRGQRYDAKGSKLGATFQVAMGYYPIISALSSAGFVVAWRDTSTANIFGQLYNAMADPLGNPFQINTDMYPNINFGAITHLMDGFVVAWLSGNDVYGQRFFFNGTCNDAAFQASNSTMHNPVSSIPRLITLANDDFVVTWDTYGNDQYTNNVYDIFGQSYSSSGIALNEIFQLNRYPIGTSQPGSTFSSLLNGDFVGVWSEQINGYYYTQRYSSMGIKLGNQLQVAQLQYSHYPLILTLPSGDFIITWADGNPDTWMQRYTVEGISVGPVLKIIMNMGPYASNMIAFPNGEFLVLGISNYGIPTGQRVYPQLNVANACDQFYYEDAMQALGLFIPPISYELKKITATVQLLDTSAGRLVRTSGEASPNYNTSTGIWSISSSTVPGINTLLQDINFVPILNNIPDAMFRVSAQDDLNNTFTGDFTLQGKPVNDAPVWIRDQLAISQGETLILNANDNILVTDIDTPDNSIFITVKFAQNGQFEFTARPGASITTFSQHNVSTGSVSFAQNGLPFAPSYQLDANDGYLTAGASTGSVDFNFAPKIDTNALSIAPGKTILLTNSQIQAMDNNNYPNELQFTVIQASDCQFEFIDQKGVIIHFTQEDINGGKVQFVSLDDKKPTYTITVNDGKISSEPSIGSVTFNANTNNKIPYIETTGFKTFVSLGTTAFGTLIGFAVWRYQRDQDAKRRRQQSIIANILRDDLTLSGVHDFTSERGAQLLEAISSIIKQLDKIDIDVIRMAKSEQENFAHKLALCLKTYVLHAPPQEILEGNIVTQPTRHLYYTKVKPFIKSNVGWLDTDAVKEAADTIASQVKLKLNTVDEEVMTDTDDNNKSTLMQPLL